MPSFQNKDYKEGTINIHTCFHEHEVTPMAEEKLSDHIIVMVFDTIIKLETSLKLIGDKGEKVHK